MTFADFPATRIAWPAGVFQLMAATGGFIQCAFTAVIVGVVEVAVETARSHVERRRDALRAYERVEWVRAEMEGWLIQQAYEGMLRAVEEGKDGAHRAMQAKIAMAELAESATGRIAACSAAGRSHDRRRSDTGTRTCARSDSSGRRGDSPTTRSSSGEDEGQIGEPASPPARLRDRHRRAQPHAPWRRSRADHPVACGPHGRAAQCRRPSERCAILRRLGPRRLGRAAASRAHRGSGRPRGPCAGRLRHRRLRGGKRQPGLPAGDRPDRGRRACRRPRGPCVRDLPLRR